MADGTRIMPEAEGCESGQGKRRQLVVAGYSVGWGICFVGAKYVLKHQLISSTPLVWLIAALPTVAAVWMLVAYTRYLRQTDELDRLIQLQAMGWGFGGGFFAICGYSVFEPLGAPTIDAATFTAIMPGLFAIGVLVGWWRYR